MWLYEAAAWIGVSVVLSSPRYPQRDRPLLSGGIVERWRSGQGGFLHTAVFVAGVDRRRVSREELADGGDVVVRRRYPYVL